MFPIVPCIKSHLPWQFHENPASRFFRNVANRQTYRHTDKATDNDENITFAMVEVIITESDKNDRLLVINTENRIEIVSDCLGSFKIVYDIEASDVSKSRRDWYLEVSHRSDLGSC